jgi:alanine racemase
MPSPTPPRSWAEIDLGAVRHNAEVARAHSKCDVMPIVKANAYGHGAVAVARAMSDIATLYGVANLHEAEELRAGGIAQPILLLSACLPGEWDEVLRQGFHLCVSTLEEASALDALAARLKTTAHVHVVVDTGMGRIGFPEHTWDSNVAAALLALRHVVCEGFASHLPSPDDDEVFTRGQIARFAKCVALARNAGMNPRWVHTASGAGLLGYAEQREMCNLVRPGLMLYGVNPLPSEDTAFSAPGLRSVMTWKTRIVLIRELPAGHGISYGRTEILKQPTMVATLACGYADGYPRQVSGKGAMVLVHGTRCPLLGRVTMDQIMVDVTDLATPAEVGNEVVLLGGQEEEFISATEVAHKAGTIAWHVFTGITTRVERQWR